MTATERAEREAVVREAQTWLGTPWHHQARVKGGGVDCGQILAGVFHAAGLIPDVDAGEYPPDWHLHRAAEHYLGLVERFMARISGPPQPGDVVLYRYGRCISHGGIVVEWPLIVHSLKGSGVILDDAEANANLAEHQAGVWSLWARRAA